MIHCLFQVGITGIVAVGVIDVFQVVQIDIDDTAVWKLLFIPQNAFIVFAAVNAGEGIMIQLGFHGRAAPHCSGGQPITVQGDDDHAGKGKKADDFKAVQRVYELLRIVLGKSDGRITQLIVVFAHIQQCGAGFIIILASQQCDLCFDVLPLAVLAGKAVLIRLIFEPGQMEAGSAFFQAIHDVVHVLDQIICVFSCHFQLDDALGTAADNTCIIDDFGGAAKLVKEGEKDAEAADQYGQQKCLNHLFQVMKGMLFENFGFHCVY